MNYGSDGYPTTKKSETLFRDGDYWKIYQTEGGNHEHRPIFGVPSNAVSEIYRVTSEP